MKFSRICSVALPATLLLTSVARADISTGLVGYWTADTANISGTTVSDSSGYANNATLVGAPTIVPGKIAQAANLTTTSQMVSVPDSSSLNLTGPFTVSVWVNFSALPNSGQYPNVVAKLNSPSSYYGYGLFWYGTGVAALIGPGSAMWYMTSSYRPTVGVWTHYATVFDGTYLTLYINGTLYSQVAAKAPGSTATIPVKMGPHYSNPSAYGVINGMLDDVRIYNRALAAADITQLYTYAAGCSYAINPSSSSIGSSGGNGSVNVTAGASCSWTASSAASWITITGGSSGTGNGTVSYSVAANTSTSSRNGTLTIGGQNFSVTQAAAAGCTYAISPTTASSSSSGGSSSVSVTAGSTCGWTASSSATWITVTAGSSGTGNGTVTYSVAANTSTSSRSGTLTIAGQTFTVNQTAAAGDTTPPNVSLTAPTGGSTVSGTVTLSASASDNVGVTKVEFYCDSTVLVGTVTAAPYSFSWNSASAANGSHSLCARAYDAAGNWTTSAGSTVTVNNTTLSVTPGQLQWAQGGVVTALYGQSRVLGMAADSSGNVIAVGDFQRSLSLGNITLTSAGGRDGFIVKYNSQGAVQWAKSFGSSVDGEAARAVTVDSAGNIIVTGCFGGNVNFGGVTLSSPANPSSPTYAYYLNTFVAKYSAAGGLLWAEAFGGVGFGLGRGVAVDGSGNVFFGASFQASASIGGLTLTSVGADDIALVKLSGANGGVLWAKSYGGTDYDQPHGLAVDRSGNLLVTGSFGTTINLGGGSISSVGSSDGFVAKYSGVDGSYIWAKTFGTASPDMGNGVAVDPTSGNVIVGGTLGGAFNFGAGLTTSGGIFLAAYNSSGNNLWAKTFNTSIIPANGNDSGNAVGVDANGNIVLCGGVTASINFGGGWLSAANNGSFFVAGFNSSGTYRWAKRVSGTAGSAAYGLAIDTLGHALSGGSIAGATDFGGVSLTTTSPTTATAVAQYSN